jgi:hypothetical protein
MRLPQLTNHPQIHKVVLTAWSELKIARDKHELDYKIRTEQLQYL